MYARGRVSNFRCLDTSTSTFLLEIRMFSGNTTMLGQLQRKLTRETCTALLPEAFTELPVQDSATYDTHYTEN